MPETFNEETVLFWEVALLRKLRGSFWRSATVLEDVIDQGLFVMNIEFRRNNVIEQCSEICIGLRRVDLGHYRKVVD
jgi:hypothetical protein